MNKQINVLRVFIASPQDLAQERKILREEVESLNQVFDSIGHVRIHLIGWEDAKPGYGRPQALINQDLDKADLFIGILWRRWGSPTGDANFSSGFEEEFRRVLDRRNKDNNPDIWQFFKQVDKTTLADPGDDLKKVLALQQEIVKNRIVFFKEFCKPSDWRKLIRNLLMAKLIDYEKEVSQASAASSAHTALQSMTSDRNPMPVEESDGAAKRESTKQIVELCKKVSGAIENSDGRTTKTHEILDDFDTARFGMTAFALLNRDHDGPMLEAHMINRLYRSRENVSLSPGESLLVLRSNLQSRNANSPGWYWLKDLPFDSAAILAYLSYGDVNFSIRKAALELCAKASISLFVDAEDGLTAIEKVCHHKDPETRKEGLKYLAAVESKESSTIVNKLLLDEYPEVAQLAYQTDFAMAAEHNASQEFRDMITRPKPVEEWQIKILRKYEDQIPSNLLSAALTHENRHVCSFAAITMAKRGLLDADLIPQLNLTAPSELWQEYYLKRIQLGDRPSIKEIRARIGNDLFGLLSIVGQAPDPRNVILTLFQEMSYEELLPYSQPNQAESVIAYEVLASKHFAAFSSTLVDDLREGFARYRDTGTHGSSPSKDVFTEQAPSSRTPFVMTALSALEQHGGPAYRSALEDYLHHLNDQIQDAAVRALGNCGDKKDNDLLMNLAKSTNSHVSRTAAEAMIKLNPGSEEILGYFLNSSDPVTFKLVTQSLGGMKPELVMPMIKNRFHNASEKIRAIACTYVVTQLTDAESEELLVWYLSSNSYYYDVVFHLDRILYGAPPLNEVFRTELSSQRDRNRVFDF